MSEINSYRELETWQVAMEAVVATYRLSAAFPDQERYGLVAQVRRAAVSVPSNIAEGCGRVSGKELQHFISIAMGSSYELETQVILTYKFKYISGEQLKDFELLLIPVQKMLFGFYNSLEK